MSRGSAGARRPTARAIAAAVIERVERTDAFASAVLDTQLEQAVQLGARDRAFATELVYGSLRASPWLLGEIARFVPRGIDAVDPRTRAHLVIAAYQVFFTRVPVFAAVSEAVDSVRGERGERVAAFANAVLRKLADRAQSVGDDERREGLITSMPAWLRGALEGALTPAQARSFLESGGPPPPVALRVERLEDRDACLERLRSTQPGASFERGLVSPLAILARGAGRPQSLPGFAEGLLSVQEEGSQLAALALGARAGEEVLDACAGRGNKAAVLARAVGPGGALDACDKSAAKLDRLGEELGRLGLRARAARAVDWTVGSGELTGSYDRVLVDAPCSGVGTLRRRPEIALRRRPPDLAAIARAQAAIVSRAAGHVRPGGVLVYVVCSVLREEAEDVVDALVRACPELEPAAFEAAPVRAIFRDAPSFRLLPHVHGTDGYFVANFVRRSRP